MRIVKFPYAEDANGSAVYPDDQSLFKNTTTIEATNEIWGEYYGEDESIPDFDPAVLGVPLGSRTVYSKAQFLDLIPRSLRQEIQAENNAGTAEVVDWVFIINAMIMIDLNNLPEGFVTGLEDMVANPNISINMTAVDNFLERGVYP